ncbi:MAG: MMPL family transporter [Candidatus Rokubacteria bacterium]|nr:MMPL family transporter [Candidatus Rokubacteria bacterium]
MIAITRTGRALRRLVRLACRRPLVTIAVSLVLAAVSIAYTLSALTFKTSTLDLLPRDAAYAVRWKEYVREFGELEDIVVVVEGGSFEAARAYAARLVQELRQSPIGFQRIAYRIDPKRFEGRQLLYLPVDELKQIRDTIVDRQEFMEQFAADPSLAQLIESINGQLMSAFVSGFLDLGIETETRGDTRFLAILLDQMTARLQRPAPYRSPWGTLFSLDDEPPADAGYFLSEDKSLLFILVEPPQGEAGSFVGDRKAIDAIREAVARLRPDFPTVQAGVTGAPALRTDEMLSAFEDSQVGTVIAFVLTLLVILLAFWAVGKPLLMLGTLAVSLCWAMGFITLTIGHLTIFSVMFISIVIGIGIDYGIYFLFRYEEEIFLGRSLKEALEITTVRTGPGILLGALTAAGTFFVLRLTDFRGIQELGVVSASAILLAWLAMMTLFPALLVVVDRRHADRPRNQEPRAHRLERIRVPWLEAITRWPKTVFAAAGVATALALVAVPSVGFDYNLLNLQATGTESVAWERRIFAITGRPGPDALSSADTLEELRKKQEAFEKLPSVAEVDSALRIIPGQQKEKIDIIKAFAEIVAPVRVGRSNPVNLDRLLHALRELKRRLDVFAVEAGTKLPADMKDVRRKLDSLIARLTRANRETAESALGHLQAQLYRDFVGKFHGLQRNLSPREIGTQDVPEELRQKFISERGRFLIQVHPRVDVWEREGATTFVQELRSVDPEVTGSPIIVYEAIGHMERGYRQGSLYALVLVTALIFLMIRRVQETALALVPLLLGVVWTIGLMHLFGLKFTLANVWGLPLIIGTAAEFGLNVVLGYMDARQHGGPLLARSTVMAVALNGVTTIIGFASLMLASHQGIYGLGLLLTLGTSCGLVASLVVLPVVLQFLPRPVSRREAVRAAVPRSTTAA